MPSVPRLLRVGQSLAVGSAMAASRTRGERMRPLDFAAFADALGEVGELADDVVLDELSIARAQELLAAGQMTSVQLTLALLARARRIEPQLRSLIELNPSVLDEARAADELRASGAEVGPLLGIPITLKDNIETAGPMRTTGGAVALAENVGAADAPLVAALRSAGAVVLAKANLSELAGAVARTPGVSAVGGRTTNPYGRQFSPGGSSSGSAVSVAAGLALASVGTETSGSLIAPSAYNGVVALKPTYGLVAGEGIVPLVRFQDTPGPVGRSVADVAALFAAMAPGAAGPRLDPGALQGVTVGILREDISNQKSPLESTTDNGLMLGRIDDALDVAGARAVDAKLVSAEPMATYEQGFAKVVLGGLTYDTMDYLAKVGAPAATLAELHAFNLARPRTRMPFGQAILSMALAAGVERAAYEQAALDHREQAHRILEDTFAACGAEVLVSLTNLHSSLYATAGFPAVTVPLGLRRNGMPTGVTLIANPGADAKLLEWAHAFESATSPRVTPSLPPAG